MARLVPDVLPQGCTITSATGDDVPLDPEQAANASTVAAVSLERGLPTRAAVIGIATAMQESKLRNLDHGDRDSLGLFQQRPSQGWGAAAQVRDPHYASERFYDHLVKVRDWQRRPLTQVAQEVQRSGFPEAYAKHEPAAQTLAAALAGDRSGALTCALDPIGESTASGPESARLVSEALGEQFGVRPRVEGDGTRVVVDTDTVRGSRAVAAWGVAHAHENRTASVSVAGRTWTRGRGEEATWRTDGSTGSGARTVVLTMSG